MHPRTYFGLFLLVALCLLLGFSVQAATDPNPEIATYVPGVPVQVAYADWESAECESCLILRTRPSEEEPWTPWLEAGCVPLTVANQSPQAYPGELPTVDWRNAIRCERMYDMEQEE